MIDAVTWLPERSVQTYIRMAAVVHGFLQDEPECPETEAAVIAHSVGTILFMCDRLEDLPDAERCGNALFDLVDTFKPVPFRPRPQGVVIGQGKANQLLDACRAAMHMTRSLLAVRDGCTDELLLEVADALESAIAGAECRTI